MHLMLQDKDEQAFKHFQQVLRLAPDHKKAMETYKKAKLLKQKKEEGNISVWFIKQLLIIHKVIYSSNYLNNLAFLTVFGIHQLI